MKKQCPWCGKTYGRFRSKCPDCKADLITENPHMISSGVAKNIYKPDNSDSTEIVKYCPECEEEYYDTVDECPECGVKLIHEKPDKNIPSDPDTREYWQEPGKWMQLTIPVTYQQGFELVRFLRDHGLRALAAFIFDDEEPRPVTLEHMDRLEHNMGYFKVPNPGHADNEKLPTGAGLPNAPRLSVLIHSEDEEEGRELLPRFMSMWQ